MSGYYLLKNGEFAYNKSYSVGYDFGSVKRLDRYPMGALSTLYICFSLTKHDSDFIKVYFDSLKWYKEIYMIAAEGARNHGLLNVPTDEFFNTQHILPTDTKEQQKIAAFMLLIEKRIEKQRQLVEALKSYKRGVLSKLFPQNDETTPQYRFAGFTEPWKEHKVGDIVDVCSGKDYKHLSEGTIPVYGTGGYMLSVSEALSYDNDAIGIGRKGTIDKPFILNAPFWTVDTLFYAVPKEKVDLNFAYAIFQNIDWKTKDESTGVPSLSKAVINDIDIFVPDYDEQQTLGLVLSEIDLLITLYKNKLDESHKVKAGLLQQLFI
ncbi:MAG: restriction endonuclease subunit S [Butyrivibrio sp.]|nr:restriction endonuclease subunit S [Butyrivibrio sp.]